MKKMLLLFLMCVLGMHMNAVSCVLTIDPDYFPGEFSCTLYKTTNLENPNPNDPWYTGVVIPSATFAQGTITSSLPQSFNFDLDYGNYVFTTEDDYGDGFGFTSGMVKLEAPSLASPLLFQFINNWGAFETRAFELLPPPPTCTEPNTGNTRVTTQAGNASAITTWVGGVIPVDGDKIIINHPIVWDIDCITNDITIHDITVANQFSITGELRCKSVHTLTSGVTLPKLTMKGCGLVSFNGTNSLSVDEIIVETADSLLFNRQTQCKRLKLPEAMVDVFYFKPDSLWAISDTNMPPIIHYPTTYNMIVDGHPKTFEYPFTHIEAGWCIEGSIGINDTLGDYDANNLTSGYTGSDDPTGWENVRWYDETVIGSPINTMHAGYIDPPFGNATILTGDAFWVYYTQGVHMRKWSSADILMGNLVKGLSFTSPDATPSNMFAGGWNLVSNPFPCTFDADSLVFTSNPKVLYTWNTNVRQYQFYNTVNHVGSRDNAIAAGQGFWVKTNASGNTLTFPQSGMLWETAEYRDVVVNTQLYTLTIADTITSYTTYIQLSENGTTDVDEYEVYELNSENSSTVCPLLLYTTVQNQAIAMQSLPNNNEDTLYVSVAGKTMHPNGLEQLSLSITDQEPVQWEIQWEGSIEWVPFTENLLIPDGILLTNIEVPIATLRLIQEETVDPDTGDPYGWSDVVDNSAKDDHSDIVSGITETNKESLIAYCSGHQQITVGSKTKIAAIYNTLGQTLSFKQNDTNVRVTTNDSILFIRTTNGARKRILMH